MERPQMITVSGHSEAVHGSMGVCPGLRGAVAGLCALPLRPEPGGVSSIKPCCWNGYNAFHCICIDHLLCGVYVSIKTKAERLGIHAPKRTMYT